MFFHGEAVGYVNAGREHILDDMDDADILKKVHALMSFGIKLGP